MQNACDDSTVRRRVTEEYHAAKSACQGPDPPSVCNVLDSMIIDYMCQHHAS